MAASMMARFGADFADFKAAVDAADKQLADFGKGAGTVETSLARMVDNFSGRKLIQEATLMSRAIQDAGGVSVLTATQLQQAGAKAAEAADKMGKLGMDVPAGLINLADAAKQAKEHTDGIVPSLHNMADGFAAQVIKGELAVQAIRAIASTVLDLAKALPELALKGAGIADVEGNFNHLLAASDRTAAGLMGALRSGTHNTITDFELMKTATGDLTAGLNLTDDQFGTLAKGAFALAQATGGDVKSGLDTMNSAMLTGRTRALALLVGKLDLGAAEKDYAKGLLATAEQLTGEGKLEAAREGILKAITAAIGRLGEQTDGLDERVAQASTAWENFTEELGKSIAKSEVLEIGMATLKTGLENTFGGHQETLVQGLTKAFEELVIVLVGTGKIAITVAQGLVANFLEAKMKIELALATLEGGLAVSAKVAQYFATTNDRYNELQGVIDLTTGKLRENITAWHDDQAALATVDEKAAGYKDVLDQVVGAMRDAQAGGTSYYDLLKNEADGHTKAGNAAGTHKDNLIKMSEAQKAYQKSLENYNAAAGPTYLDLINKIGNAMYEGIAFDHGRQQSTTDIANVYHVNEGIVRQVIQAEKDWKESQKALDDEVKHVAQSMSDSEAAGVAAATAVGNAFKGPQTVLKDLIIQGGLVPISFKSMLTPAQEVGFVVRDMSILATAHMKTIRDETVHWQSSCDSLGKSLSDVGRAAGGMFGTFLQQIGPAISAAEKLSNAMAMSGIGGGAAGPGGGDAGKNVGGAAAGLGGAGAAAALATTTLAIAAAWVGVAIAVYSVVNAIMEANKEAEKQKKLADENMKLVASSGASTPFSGGLRQSLVESRDLLANITEINSKYNDLIPAHSVAKGMGVAPAIPETPVTLSDLTEAMHLSDVVKELGGYAALTATQMNYVKRETNDLFILIALGGPVGATALKQMDDSLIAIGPAAMKSGGLVDKFFLDMAAKAQAAGVHLKDVEEFLTGQAKAAETGLGAALKVTNDAYTKRADLQTQIAAVTGTSDADAQKRKDLIEQLRVQDQIVQATTIHTQGAADAVSASLLGIINAQVAAGASFHDSVLAIAPSVEELQRQMVAAGFQGGAAFELLHAQVSLATDAVAGPGLTSIQGYADGLVAMNNAGLLNQDMFAGLTQQIGQTFGSLVAQGKDGGQVMIAMQGPLQRMWELEQKFGYKTDEATQALIDQAAQQGLVGEQFKPISEQMLDATIQIADAIKRVADALAPVTTQSEKTGDQMSTSFGKANDKTTEVTDSTQRLIDKLKSVPNVDYTITGHYVVAGSPGGGSEDQAQSHSLGGKVIYAAGGWGRPYGTDTVRAWLTPGERVLSLADTKSFDSAGGIAALRRGGGATVIDFASFVSEQKATREEMATLRRELSTQIAQALARAVRDQVVQARAGRR